MTMLISEKKEMGRYFLYIAIIPLILTAKADFNDSTLTFNPAQQQSAPASVREERFYGGWDEDGDDFQKPGGSPLDSYESTLWLVPVLSYLLVIENGSLRPMTPVIGLLPVLISTAISLWFAEEQAETIAWQNSYTPLTPLAHPFPLEASGDHPVLVHEAPRVTSNPKKIRLGSGGGSTADSGGTGGTLPPPDEGSGDQEEGSGERPPADGASPLLKHSHLDVIIVRRDMEVCGQNYTVCAYLRGETEQLFCVICRYLVKPDAIKCRNRICKRMICEYHVSDLKDGKCPTCREKHEFETQDCSLALSQILWECPECEQSFSESNIGSHLLACGPAFACEFAGYGCTVTGNYEQVQQHESRCPYRPETCPNQHCAKVVFQRDIASHVAVCEYTQTQIPGTTVSGPALQVRPVINAIEVFNCFQADNQALWEVARQGFSNLLSITQQVTAAIDSDSKACQTDSVTSPFPFPCPACNQPVQADGGHDCDPKRCPNCYNDLTYAEINFHRRFCHERTRFAGRILLLQPANGPDCNYIIYTGDCSRSCYVFLPEDTFADEEIPIKLEADLEDALLRINLSVKRIYISIVDIRSNQTLNVKYMLKFFNSQGRSLSSALHCESQYTIDFNLHPEIAEIMRQAQILVVYIGLIN